MKQTILITGGSSGIGFGLAKHFAKEKHDLLLIAKPQDELDNAKYYLVKYFGITVHVLAKDLARQEAAQEVYNFVKSKKLDIDILVNNAGFGMYGYINELDSKQERDMLLLNMVTVQQLTRLFLKDMIAKNRGKIVNIASIAAFQPNPFFATYGATKSFVYNFSRAINYELKERKSAVRVLCICPPATRQTGFQQKAGMNNTNTFTGFGTLDVAVVAHDAYHAIQRNQEFSIPGFGLRWVSILFNRLPTALRMWIVRRKLL